MDISTEENKLEIEMHKIISGLKVPFYSQEPIPGLGKGYVADFLIMHAIVVETDGPQHGKTRQSIKDEHRDEAMKQLGLRILRFTTEQVYDEPEMCAAKIQAEIRKLPAEIVREAYLPAGHHYDSLNVE